MSDEVSLKSVVEARRKEKEAAEEMFNLLRMLDFTVLDPKGFWVEAIFQRGDPGDPGVTGGGYVSVSYNPALVPYGRPSCLLKTNGDKFTFSPVDDLNEAIEAASMFVDQIKQRMDGADEILSKYPAQLNASQALQAGLTAKRKERVDLVFGAVQDPRADASSYFAAATAKKFAEAIDTSLTENRLLKTILRK